MLKDFIKNSTELNIKNIIVLQKGKKIGEHNFYPPAKHNQYSITKSFVSIATGIAIEEGLISLEDAIQGLEGVKVKHLLTMTKGEKSSNLMSPEREKIDPKKWMKYSLNIEHIYKPGSKFVYTNTAPYILGNLIAEKAGTSLKDYLSERLFEPLNIEIPVWEEDGYGNQFGSSGMELTTDELSRFGQMLLQKGEYNGKRIVSEDWINEATKAHVATEDEGEDYNQYGYLFWPSKYKNYRADGKAGQFCIVIDDKDAVIAVNSNEEKAHLILENIWKYIYPKLY